MDLKNKISHLPKKPGVYIFKNSSGKIIYIGKTVSLKSRVSSYFSGKPSNPKTSQLIKRIRDLDFIVVDSETEALLLEANLIRKHKPKYNIALKDDKRYPYIKITDEPFPRIEITRSKNNKEKFFGPYTEAYAAKRTLKLIKENFRIRHCKHKLPDTSPQRPCLNFHINRCDAPCAGKITQEEYQSRIDEAILLLKGRKRELVSRLKRKMKLKSEQEDFEEAALIRDQIAAIETVWQKQKIDMDTSDRDLHAIAIGLKEGVAVAMQVREGRVIARQEFRVSISQGSEKAEVMRGYLIQYYNKNINPPKEILVSVLPHEKKDINKLVSKLRGSKVEVRVPKRGEKKDLIKLVERNAELLLSELVRVKKKVHLPYSVIDLQKELRLKKPPRNIEAIDISHLAGTQAVGSLVSFKDGKKFSAGYRRFRIKTATHGDDYESIYEVVTRRISRLKEEAKPMPDLLLIDGGKGQLASAERALVDLELRDEIELASIAKRLEEVFRPGMKDSIMMPKDSSALRLLVKLRDEAHRFAISYQRVRRSQKYKAGELMRIPGVGPKRQRTLLQKYDSLEQIAGETPESLSEKGKVPIGIAEKIINALALFKAGIVLLAMMTMLWGGCTPSPRYLARPDKQVHPVKKTEKSQKEKTKTAKKKKIESQSVESISYESKTESTDAKSISGGEEISKSRLMGIVNLYLGTPYVYGGDDFDGIDCSAFVQNALKELGIDIPRTSRDQYRSGKSVRNPRFGDLVFFRMKMGGVDHVGLYLGDRRFAHASSHLGVTIDSLDDPYYSVRFLGARRYY